MILANYFSAWVGVGLQVWISGWGGTYVDVNNVRLAFWGLMACAYLITLLLEFPFVALCFWKAEHWFRKTVKATLLVQTASYLLLCIGYLLAGDVSLMRDLQVVDRSELILPTQATLYYIAEDESVCYAPLSGGTPVKIGRMSPAFDSPLQCLVLATSKTHPDRCSLNYKLEDYNFKASKKTVVDDVCTRASTNVGQKEFYEELPGPGPSLRLGAAKNSPWGFENNFFGPMSSGLIGVNEKTGEDVYFGLESPLLWWQVRHINHLPDDVVVFQLSNHQICAIDVPTRRIALLARGRSPVVVLDGTPPPTPPAGADLPVISLGKGGEE